MGEEASIWTIIHRRWWVDMRAGWGDRLVAASIAEVINDDGDGRQDQNRSP
jgi:hypothetical protein